MRKLFNSQVAVSHGTIGSQPDPSGPFARRTPVTQLLEEKLGNKKRYAYDSMQNNEFTRAQRTLGSKKRQLDRFQNKHTEMYQAKHMTQRIEKFQGFGVPSNNLRSKTKEIADKVKNQAKQRLSSPPQEPNIEQRTRKVSYLMDLLNKRNAITDPNSKSQSAVEVISHQKSTERFSQHKDVILSVNTTKVGQRLDKNVQQQLRQHQKSSRSLQLAKLSQPAVTRELAPSENLIAEPAIMIQQQDNSSKASKEMLALLPPEASMAALKKEMKQLRASIKPAMSHKIPIVAEQGYSSDEVDQAFMTQYPHKDGVLLEELKDENLKVSMTKNVKNKTKKIKKQEKSLGKVLKHLGIKDKYMMDHFYPQFHAALERKIQHRIQKDHEEQLQLKGGTDVDYANMNLVYLGQKDRYKWVELYDSQLVDPSRLKSGERARKMISRKAFLNEDYERKKHALENQKQPKRLKICKFDDAQLNRMFKKEKSEAREDLQLMLYKKAQKSAPYMEKINTAAVPENPCKSKQVAQLAVKRLHLLSEKILEQLTESRRAKGLLDEEYYLAAKSELQALFNPEDFVNDEFNRLDIDHLQDYIAQSMKIASHVNDQDVQKLQEPVDGEIISISESGAPRQKVPSYKERVAFINNMKKMWKVQKGYCSVFERARADRIKRMKKRVQRQEWKERRKLKRKAIAQALLKYVEERKLVANVPQERLFDMSKPRSQSTLEIETGRLAKLHNTSQQELGSTARIGEPMSESALEALQAQMKKQHGLLRDSYDHVALPRDSVKTDNLSGLKQDSNSRSRKILMLPQTTDEIDGFQMGMTELMASGEGGSHRGGMSPKSLYDWARKHQAREFESRQLHHRTQLDKVVKDDLEQLERIVRHDNDDLDVMQPPTHMTVTSEMRLQNNTTFQQNEYSAKDKTLTIKGNAIEEHKARTRMKSAKRSNNASKKFTTQTLSIKEATMQTQNLRDSLASNQLKGDDIEKILQYNQKKIVLQRSLSQDKAERQKQSDLSSVVLSPAAKVELIEGSTKAQIFAKAKEMEATFSALIDQKSETQDIGLDPQASLVSRQSPILIHSTMRQHEETKEYMKKTTAPGKVVVHMQEPPKDPMALLKNLQGLAQKAERQAITMKNMDLDYRKVHPQVAFSKSAPKQFPQRMGPTKRSKDIARLQARNSSVAVTDKTEVVQPGTPPEHIYANKQVHQIPASVVTELGPQSPGTALKNPPDALSSPYTANNMRQQLSSDETSEEQGQNRRQLVLEGKGIELETKTAKSIKDDAVSPGRTDRVRIAQVIESKVLPEHKHSSQALIEQSQDPLSSMQTQNRITQRNENAYFETSGNLPNAAGGERVSKQYEFTVNKQPSETKETQQAQSARFKDQSKIYLHDGLQMAGSQEGLKISTQHSVRKSHGQPDILGRHINQDSQQSLQDSKPAHHNPIYSRRELNSDLNPAISAKQYTSIDSAAGSKIIKSFDSDNLPKASMAPNYHPAPQQNARLTSALKKELDQPHNEYGVEKRKRKFSPVSRALELSHSLDKGKFNALRQSKMIHGALKEDDIYSGHQDLRPQPVPNDEQMTHGEHVVENPSVDDSIAEIMVLTQPLVVKPWTFIKNEQYFSKLANMNPNSFAISGQGVIQSKPMTAKQILNENKQRQRTKRGQNTYLASTGIAFNYDTNAISRQQNQKPNDSFHLFGRQTNSKSAYMVDSQTQPEESQSKFMDPDGSHNVPKTMHLLTGGTDEQEALRKLLTDDRSDEVKLASPKETGTETFSLNKNASKQVLIKNMQFPDTNAVKISDEQVDPPVVQQPDKPSLKPIAPLIEPKQRVQSGVMRLKKTVNARLQNNKSGDLFMVHGMQLKTKNQQKVMPQTAGQRSSSNIKIREMGPQKESIQAARREVGESITFKQSVEQEKQPEEQPAVEQSDTKGDKPTESPLKSEEDDMTQPAYSAVKNSSL